MKPENYHPPTKAFWWNIPGNNQEAVTLIILPWVPCLKNFDLHQDLHFIDIHTDYQLRSLLGIDDFMGIYLVILRNKTE
jgi:hypothetical protein